MTARGDSPNKERFWTLAKPLLRRAGVTRSTMMGFPCLRLDGDFFASSKKPSSSPLPAVELTWTQRKR